ncbi:hypothetical protein K3495_g12778 [Podosphaera aphanis]|nr:hypothetical protein K3495_g12778 [Podosphaera aphanis]
MFRVVLHLLFLFSLGHALAAASTLHYHRQLTNSSAPPPSDLVPADTPEARCDTHVYTTDYIRRTLDTVTDLGAQHATMGNSPFPRPFGDNALMMIYPLLRSDEIYNGTVAPPGPDRIVVGMTGKRRYFILTVVDKNPDGDEDVKYYRTCEYLPSALAALLQGSMDKRTG